MESITENHNHEDTVLKPVKKPGITALDANNKNGIGILINTGDSDCDALIKVYFLFENSSAEKPIEKLGRRAITMFGKTAHANMVFSRAVNYLASYMDFVFARIKGTA